MEITKQSVLKALKSLPKGGTTAAVSGEFGISGTNSEVSRILREMHEAGEVKRTITYTDTVFHA